LFPCHLVQRHAVKCSPSAGESCRSPVGVDASGWGVSTLVAGNSVGTAGSVSPRGVTLEPVNLQEVPLHRIICSSNSSAGSASAPALSCGTSTALPSPMATHREVRAHIGARKTTGSPSLETAPTAPSAKSSQPSRCSPKASPAANSGNGRGAGGGGRGGERCSAGRGCKPQANHGGSRASAESLGRGGGGRGKNAEDVQGLQGEARSAASATGRRTGASAASPRPAKAEAASRRPPAAPSAAASAPAAAASAALAVVPASLPAPDAAARGPAALPNPQQQQLASGAAGPAASSVASVGGGGGGSTAAKLSELRSKLERSLRTAEEGLSAELQQLDQRLQSHRQSVAQCTGSQASLGTEG